jgi:S1-C subfamily serine protease
MIDGKEAPMRILRILALLVLSPIATTSVRAVEIETSPFAAVVKLDVKVSSEARSASILGTEREGSGVLIDGDGLILTIGYLIMEASEATVETGDGRIVAAQPVAYDHESGFGLLRTLKPLGIKPIELGDSRKLRERDAVLIAGHGGRGEAAPAYVVSRREFAGPWEYLLENAVFTAPAYDNFGGAALIDSGGKLVGIGSLLVPDAIHPGVALQGNMFVPIEKLTPILADLLATGRNAGPRRPWIGLRGDEYRGRLFIDGVTPGGPAAKAGLKPGDLVVGVAGKPIEGMADFYRKMWRVGQPGAIVPLQVVDGMTVREVRLKSIDRYDWYKAAPTY